MNRAGWIGIDIGADCVKMAQLSRNGAHLSLRAASIVRRELAWPQFDGCDADPLPSDREMKLGRRMDDQFRGRLTAALMPMDTCELHSLAIPTAVTRDSRHEIERRLQDTHHVPVNSRRWDHWTIHPQGLGRPDDDNTYVLVTSRAWAQQIAADHGRAGLLCQSLDGLPTTLARAIELAYGRTPNEPIGVLDWGFSRTTFCSVIEGSPAFVRVLRDAGVRHSMECAENSWGLNRDETCRLMHAEIGGSTAVATAVPQIVSGVTAPAVEEVTRELKKTLEFLGIQRKRLIPQRIIVTGGGATLPGVCDQLSQEIEIGCEPWRPPFNPEVVAPEMLPLFASAVALSFLAWRKP